MPFTFFHTLAELHARLRWLWQSGGGGVSAGAGGGLAPALQPPPVSRLLRDHNTRSGKTLWIVRIPENFYFDARREAFFAFFYFFSAPAAPSFFSSSQQRWQCSSNSNSGNALYCGPREAGHSHGGASLEKQVYAAKLGWQPVRRPPVVGGQLKAES